MSANTSQIVTGELLRSAQFASGQAGLHSPHSLAVAYFEVVELNIKKHKLTSHLTRSLKTFAVPTELPPLDTGPDRAKFFLMLPPGKPDEIYRFGAFELRPATGELYKHGLRIKLQDQPLRILILLLDHAGEVVTREQIQKRLWAEDTYVDYENAISTAVRKLRDTFSDTAVAPRFIETLARRGYRFIAPVSRIPICPVTAGSPPETTALENEREPEWERVPPKVQPLLRRYLEKDPARRLRDISAVELLPEDAPVAAGMRPGNKTWIAFAGVFALAAAAVSYIHFREKPAERQVLRYSVGPPGNAVLDLVGESAVSGGLMSGWLSPIAISPDGRKVVFSATSADGKNQLWVRFLDTLPARPLAGTEKARYPFWSPDSRSLGFGADGKLKRIDINGGPALTLADAPDFIGGTWNREDAILFVPGYDERVMRVGAAGGTPNPATGAEDTKEEHGHRWPSFLPDGRHFLFAKPVTEWGHQSDHVTICAGSLDSPEFKMVAEADSNAVYAEGYLLFLRESTLMAQPFDLKRLSVAGDAVPLAERVQHNPPSAKGLFSVSENGVLAYSAGDRNARRLTWFDRKGNRLSTAGEPGEFGVMHISPDRKKLAVSVNDRDDTDIWIYDLPRGLGTRFTSDAALNEDAVWSPDGRSMVFDSNRSGQLDLYRKASDGTGTEELLYADGVNKFPEDWSPDGRFLLYSTFDAKTKADIWVLPMRAERVAAPLKPYPWLRTAFIEVNCKFSPDGRWVAYQSNESGRLEIYVAPFPGPGAKQQVSTAGGHYARWRKDGREIFYLGPDRELMAVEVDAKGTTVEIGKAQRLFGPLVSGLGYLYDVSADGQRFLAAVPPEEKVTQELTVVQNWMAGLKK